MTMTDLKEKVLDCNIAIGLAIVGVLYNWLINGNILDSIYGLVAGVIIMEAVARIGYLFTDDRAFGEGDTYVAGALGACLGIVGLFQTLLYTLIASMFFIIPIPLSLSEILIIAMAIAIFVYIGRKSGNDR
jgi:prepilin signal peptidase PulO-like enzyme (type II secretory pathway)